ncbi:MAG: nuclease-related domain-containing protein, partial [bacterium]
MAIKYNRIGSLTELLKKLKEQDVDNFHTLDEIRSFRNNFNNSLNFIKQKNKEYLLQDIINLESEYKKLSPGLDYAIKGREELLIKEKTEIILQIAHLENTKNIIMVLINWFKKRKMLKRNFILETQFKEEIKRPFQNQINKIDLLKQEYADKKNNIEKWVDSLSKEEINRNKFILSLLDENNPLFYGAEGEELAFGELVKLPDSYVVINDYRRQFDRPIYDRKNDDRIHSIQIDHIVVGPTGIYLVETKNWSQDSAENRDLFSPVKQLRRSSFAMFVLLNQAIDNGKLSVFNQNWGEQKISPKNIILFINHKPVKEFQYVKILS